MAALCSRSEQCSAGIMRKLLAKGLSASDARWVLDNLYERKFVDDSRFARSFANDKVRLSSWGRLKIRMALKAKRIPDSLIAEAFDELDPDEYAAAAERVATRSASGLDLNQRTDRAILYRHLVSRGFESDIAMRELEKLCRRDN